MWRGDSGLLALLILLLASNLSGGASDDLGKALESYQAHRFEEAKRRFEAFIEEFPQDLNLPRALYHLAELERDPSTVLEYYGRILAEHPQSEVADSALFRIGLYRIASGQSGEAGGAFTRLLAQYPQSALVQKARYWLAISCLARNDRVSAIGELKEVVRTSPHSEYGKLAKADLERLEGGLKPPTGRDTLTPPVARPKYMVQVGSFGELEAALGLERKLETRGYVACLDEAVVGERTFYRVRVGPYLSEEEARRIAERLALEERVQCWVVKTEP